MNKKLYLFATAASCLLPFGCASAQSTSALKQLSFDELLELEVTSVSKRNNPLPAAPASIVVLTADAIRRSGATTLTEALRLAPNLLVARIELDVWLAWFVTDALELAIDGRNLLHAMHAEYGEANARSEIERSFHGLMRWRF